ncbi:malectin domain-containing carbohydrate-binding protein [Robiginitalea sediminis]|uniref:malectin domain-containing carbohydrate-binding protein n=1 Tax=Robiginitalea sediminis TaxID=1982593 RepID=UPI000B4B1B78|nr:malectin domain-containing carbohydrate-binding protein [Robiginitalea sediminis]
MERFVLPILEATLRSFNALINGRKSNLTPLPEPVRPDSKPYRNWLPLAVLLVALSGVGSWQSAMAQADMSVTPATSTVNTGDTFSLTVEIAANGVTYSTADAYLSFDPAILEVQSVTAGGTELPIPLLSVSNNTLGTVQYSAGNFAAPTTADIDLVVIEFQAIAEGTTTVDFYDPDGADPIQSGVFLTGTNFVNSLTGASVTVGTANQNPVASFSITPNPAETNQVVSFDGTGSTDDGTIVSWEWDFDGDGNFDDTTSGANTTFSYTTATTYTVTLRVTDDGGLQGVSQQPITITSPSITTYTVNASAGPNGSISPSGAVSVDENDNITFTITPDPGFEIAELLVNGNPEPPTLSYEFVGVTQNSSISVTFQEIPPFQLCIASGSADLVAFGRNFVGDPATAPPTGLGFTRTNGTVFSNYSNAIAGTTPGSGEELLFQKEIYGGAPANPAFIYDIPVSNGFYQVDLYFAEVFHPSSGGRVFDVFLDGNLILDEYDLVDPIKDGLSSNQTAITRTYFVQVTDGSVSLQIGDATIDNGKLSGICVTEVSSANLHPLSAIGDFSVNAGEAAAVLLNINDPENDPLTVTLNGLPASLTYNTGNGQLEGTPLPGDAGVYTINVIVSDGTSAPVTEEFTLTINPPAGDDPPAIAAIADVFANEGDAISVPIAVTDDTNPAATIEIFDVSAGGTNPFTPTTTVTVGSLTDNGGGSYTFDWTPAPGEGKSYLAVVTANDGVNLPVTESFRINVAQQLPGTILARTFFNPDPWYGSSSPTSPYTVAIEDNANQNIGYINNGDFVDYLIHVPVAGTYDLELFAGKGVAGTTVITVSEETTSGFNPIGTLNVVQTGWQTYVPYTAQVTFANPGVQTLRLAFNGGANVRDFNFTTPLDVPPTIDPIANVEVSEGGTVNQVIQVNDDSNPNASIVIYDKSVFNTGGNTTPFTSGLEVPSSDYTFTENPVGSGTWTLNWVTAPGDGRAYLARITADDGANPPVTEEFLIDIAQPVPATVLARTFANPLPWYGGSPAAPFTVAIENTAAQNIGWIDTGEFVEYFIDVPAAGTYTVEMFAGNGSGAATTVTYLEESGTGFTPIGSVVAPATAWQSYSGYATDITFTSPGPQTLRLEFNGGVNIRDFVFTLVSDNATPVVVINSPADGIYATSDVSLSFTGTANDTEDGDLSAAISWSSNLDGALGVGASVNASLSVGTHIVTASATDLDVADPQTGESTIIVNVVESDPFCATPSFRVNAGGPAILSANGDFEEDQKASGPTNGTAQLGTPSPYLDLTPPALDQTFGSNAPLVSNTTGYPDYLFQTERYSEAANPDNMNWAFPTGNGVFEVKLLFNENWTGEINSPRVFDVLIEGDLALDDYRPSGPTGADVNVAKVETYTATVTDGVLNINFIQGTQNPSIKGIDICFVSDLNTAPVVAITAPTAGASVSRGQAITLEATANDTEDGDVSSSIQWTSDSDTQFTPAGSGGSTTGTFVTPGTQLLRATAADSETLQGFDEISVEVSAPAVTFVSPTSGSTLSSLTVNVEVSTTDVLFGNTEHFHFFINPPDPNTLDINTRVSTAPATAPWKLSDTEFVFDENSGALSANGQGNGIVEGENTLIVIVADQFHTEFTNPEARAEVTFDVCLVSITDVSLEDPSGCTTNDGSFQVTATGSNLEYSSNGGTDFFQNGGAFSGLSAGTYDIVVRSVDNPDCTATTQVVLNDPAGPMPVISGPLTYLQGTPGVTLDAGAGYTSYLWSTGETSQTIDVTAGTYFVTVTDSNGCTGTSVSVIVTEDPDTIAPSAVCKNIEIFLDENGVATLTAEDIDGGSTDNVAIASLVASTTSFDCSSLGPNQVMLTVTDVNNNTDFCMATVTVTDPVAPVVSCAANVIVTSSNGSPVIVTVPEPGILDNCDSGLTATAVRSDNASLTLSDPFPVGTTQITWSVTDASGNTGTCFQNVIVNFTASAANDIVSFTVGGQVGASDINAVSHTVAFTMPFGTDLSDLTPTIGVSPFASIDPDTGVPNDFTSPVQYTVTAQDNSQQIWEVTASLEADGENPVVTCPGDITVSNDTDQCGAVVTFSASATDNDGSAPSLSYSHAPGSFFEAGTTTVTVTATDLAGNTAQCTFNVTVNDGQAPDIVCPGDQTLTGDISGNLSMPDLTGLASAVDNCDASVVVTQSPVAGTAVSGITLVTLTAEDLSGNTATCSFNLTVELASEANLVIAPASMEVTLFEGQTADVFYTVDSDDASTLPTPAAMTLTDNASGVAPTWAATTSAANQDTPYEVIFNSAGLAPGTYTGVLEAGPVTGYTNASIPITLNVVAVPPLGVLEFVLVDADADVDLFTITEGMQIDVNTLPTANLNIRAEAGPLTESVVLQLSGPLTKSQTESVPPYALYGDASGNYNPQVFPLGTYNLNATAYSGNSGSGTAGATANVSFAFTDQDPACASFLALLESSTDPTTCSGTDGSATLSVSGATGAVSYDWSHDAGLNGPTATGLAAGAYSVTVTDQNGCVDVVAFTLTGPALPIVSLAPFANVVTTDAPFALTGGSPAGGTYSGTGVSGGFFDPSVGPGTFPITYTYTDGNGCSNSAVQSITVTAELDNSALIVLDATTDTELFALVDGMTIYKSDIGETPLGIIYNADLNPGGVQFNLSGPLTQNRFEGPAPHSLFGDKGVDIQGKPFPVGSYVLIADPNNGPTLTVNFTVADEDPLCAGFDASLASTSPATSCLVSNGSATIAVSGATGSVTYAWSHNGGLNSPTATGLAPGNYSVTATDANGCSDTLTFSLSGPPLPAVTLAPFASVLSTDAPFALSGGSPAGGTYSGTGVSGGVFDPSVGPGSFPITYTYTDGNGCTNSAVQTILVTAVGGSSPLIVLNANTDTELFRLFDGMVIDKASIGETPLGVIFDPAVTSGGVQFNLTGPINESRFESPAPRSLFGDIGTNILGKPFPVGNYTLVANPNIGPTITVNFSVVQSPATAKIAPVIPMTASPNPADTEVQVTFEEPVRLVSLHVFDTSGKLVKVVQAGGDENLTSYQLQVMDLPIGIYYIRATDAYGNSYQEEVVVSRYR